MYYPENEIREVNHTVPTQLKWAIVGPKGTLGACFWKSSNYHLSDKPESKDMLVFKPLQKGLVVKWRKNKQTDRIQWGYGLGLEWRNIHAQFQLDKYPNSQAPSEPTVNNRYYYCLGLAMMIVMPYPLELRAYTGRDVASSRCLWVKKAKLPSLDSLQADMERKGFALRPNNNEHTTYNVNQVFHYLWMHLPYDFTGRDHILKLQSLKHSSRWAPKKA